MRIKNSRLAEFHTAAPSVVGYDSKEIISATINNSTEYTGKIDELTELLGTELCRELGIYPLPEGLEISVVVPIYNEKTTVEEIVRRVRAVPIPKEIILVDDGTRDVLAATMFASCCDYPSACKWTV